MGKKSHTKSHNKANGKQAKEGLPSQNNLPQRAVKYKLSPQKRNEVNQLVDKLLKGLSSFKVLWVNYIICNIGYIFKL